MKTAITRTGLTIGIFVALAGVASAVALRETTSPLIAAISPNQFVPNSLPVLSPCTTEDIRHAQLFFRNSAFDTWSRQYHAQVNDVVNEYVRETSRRLDCWGDNILPVQGTRLYALAQQLAPWQRAAALDALNDDDIGAVLLEFLRVYECAMTEHKSFLPASIVTERFLEEAGGTVPGPVTIEGFTQDSLSKEIVRQQTIIHRELATARPTLERTLGVLSGMGRMRPLDAELQCLQRASLDIRNAIALSSDAASCLPRMWDSRDVLRDITQ